jgi:hypothetical protein
MGQMIRLKQANEMLKGTASKVNWRELILEGDGTEISGYHITRKMLISIENLIINPEFIPLSTLIWIELATKDITPATMRFCKNISPSKLKLQAFDCPLFWQVPDIFDLPELRSLNCETLSRSLQ